MGVLTMIRPYYIIQVQYTPSPVNSVILDRLIFKKKEHAINYLEHMHSRSLSNYNINYTFKLEKIQTDCKSCKSIKVTNIKLPKFKRHLEMEEDTNG
jgi:hypothetical protein